MIRRYVKPILTLLCICAVTFSTIVALGAEETKESKPENAAMVNGQPIKYKDFELQFGVQQNRMRTSGKSVDQIKAETLDFLINNELLYQQSAKKGIKVDDKRVDEELSAFKLRFKDPKKFDEWLAQMKMSLEELKSHFKQNMAVRQLVAMEIEPKVKVADKDAKKFYDDNPKFFQKPESVRARHILIKVDKNADAKQKEAARKKLLDIKKRLDKGEKFEDLAKALSEGPSSSRGGDLGYFSRGKMVPSFEKVAFSLKPDEVSDIVETQFGYHLIKLVDRKGPEKVDFKEVESRIKEELSKKETMELVQTYIDDLRKNAKIEKLIETSDATKK